MQDYQGPRPPTPEMDILQDLHFNRANESGANYQLDPVDAGEAFLRRMNDLRIIDEGPNLDAYHAAFDEEGALPGAPPEVHDHDSHVRMCENYRSILRGERTCLLDSDEHAYVEACAEAREQEKPKPRPPRSAGGARPGIEKPIPGQTIGQMLQVRGEIRYANYLNKRAKREALAGLEPGSQAYYAALDANSSRAIEDFCSRMQRSNGKLLPSVVVEIRGKIDRMWLASRDYKRTTQPMSTFADMIIDLSTSINVYARPGHAFTLYMLSRIVSNAGMEFGQPTVSLLVPGQKSAGKTRGFNVTAECSPDGMHNTVTYRTAKSGLTHDDCDMQNVIVDEATHDLIGKADSSEGTSSSIFKSSMTAKDKVLITTYCDTSGEDGVRRIGVAASSRSGTFLVATNEQLENRQTSPDLARYLIKEATVVAPENHNAIENRMNSTFVGTPEISARMALLRDQMITDTSFLIIVECAIATNTICNVELAPVQVYLQMFHADLSAHEMNLSDPKRVKHLSKVIRTLTIMRACFYAFRSEKTAHLRIDANGNRIPFWEYVPTALRTIEPLLCPDYEICAYAFTLLEFLWIDEQTERIATGVALMTETNKYIDHTNANNAGGANLLGRGSLRSALTPTLASKLVQASARGAKAVASKDESKNKKKAAPIAAVAAAPIDPARFPDRPMLGGAARGPGFRVPTGVAGGVSPEELQARQYMRGPDVPHLFLPINTTTGEMEINAQYVAISSQPFSGAKALARKLQTQNRDEFSSIENIVCAVRTMSQTDIESPLFVYNPHTNKINVKGESKVRQTALMRVELRNQNYYHGASASHSGGSGYIYFIATEALVNPHLFRSIFYRALKGMCYHGTLPREHVVLGVPVRAPEFAQETRDGGRMIDFHGIYQTISVEPRKGRMHKIAHYTAVDTVTAIQMSGTYGDGRADPGAPLSTGNWKTHEATEIVMVDVDEHFAKQIGQKLGKKPEACCWWMIDNAELLDDADISDEELAQKVADVHYFYPDDAVRNRQSERFRIMGISHSNLVRDERMAPVERSESFARILRAKAKRKRVAAERRAAAGPPKKRAALLKDINIDQALVATDNVFSDAILANDTPEARKNYQRRLEEHARKRACGMLTPRRQASAAPMQIEEAPAVESGEPMPFF